jgi:hypothetical protein
MIGAAGPVRQSVSRPGLRNAAPTSFRTSDYVNPRILQALPPRQLTGRRQTRFRPYGARSRR